MASIVTTFAMTFFAFLGVATLGMFLFQNALLYLPDRYPLATLLQAARDAGVEPWPSADEGYRGLIASGGLTESLGTVVVFHGNAGSALDRMHYARALTPLGYRVLLAEYPRYGARDGTLGEQSLVSDAAATVAALRQQFGGPLYVWGESLGCGVATAMGAKASLAVEGLVLITPWKNLPELAQSIYWFVPARWLVRDRYDNIANLGSFSNPVAVVLAGDDEIIPKQQTMALFEAILSPKQLWVFKNAFHNTWPTAPHEKWWREVSAFTGQGKAELTGAQPAS